MKAALADIPEAEFRNARSFGRVDAMDALAAIVDSLGEAGFAHVPPSLSAEERSEIVRVASRRLAQRGAPTLASWVTNALEQLSLTGENQVDERVAARLLDESVSIASRIRHLKPKTSVPSSAQAGELTP